MPETAIGRQPDRFVMNNCKIANELRKYRDLSGCVNQVSLSGARVRRPSDAADYAEYCISEDYDYEQSSAPEGYRWVCAARKKDIQWAKMLELAQNNAKKKYSELKNRFERKSEPGILEKITEEGIVSFGDVLYLKGESLQDYLMRNHVDDSAKYPVSFYQYLSESSGYVEKIVDYKASCADRSRAEFECDEDVASFIESLDGESVLVGVDCHI